MSSEEGVRVCFVEEFLKLRKATVSFARYFRQSAFNNSAATGGIFVKIYTRDFQQNLPPRRQRKYTKQCTYSYGDRLPIRYSNPEITRIAIQAVTVTVVAV
jgi:hypothetical protein